MNRFLLLLATCLVLGIGALFVVPNYVDWNTYRGVFEDQASRIIGREVKVFGDVKLKLLPAPYLEFGKVKVLDKEQYVRDGGRTLSKQPVFAEVDAFKLWLAIPPLLRGDVRVKKLELADPHFFFRFDRNGQANWSGLGQGRGTALEFLPGNVAFDSVNISRGKVSLLQSGSREPLTIEGVSGELAAESLSGPYRFAGQFDYLGDKRTLNFSTGEQNSLGAMRVKSVFGVPASGSRYIVEGELQDFSHSPSFRGALSGQIPIGSDNSAAVSGVSGGDNFLELKSSLNATLKRIELKDLSLNVENSKRPQSVNGVAILDWKRGFNLQARLKASWLNLDQMLGNNVSGDQVAQKFDNDSVQSAAQLLLASLRNMGAFVSRAAVHAEIVEAKLGGSQLNNFELHLTKSLDRFRISKFSVQLPGRNQLKLSGDLGLKSDSLTFNGPVSIKGISLGALSHWAFVKDNSKITFKSNPYFLRGNINYSPVRFEIGDLRGDLNGARVSGRFKYDLAKRKEFVLELDSDKVDLRDVVDANTTLKSMIFTMFDSSGEDGAESGTDTAFDDTAEDDGNFMDQIANLEGRINLRMGRIELPEFSGQDVVVDGVLRGGKFVLRSFKMESEQDLSVTGKGQINDLKGEPQGNLRFSLVADSADGLKRFGRQIDLPESITNNPRLMRDLSPLRLAISLNMVSGSFPSTEINVAGSAAKSQITIHARHEGALGTLGERQLEVSGSMINPNAASLIAQLSRDKVARRIDENGQGSFSIQLSGTPEKALDTKATLDAGSTQANFEGILRVAGGQSSGHGRIKLNSSNGAAGLSLIGIDKASGFSGEDLKLSANLVKKRNLYKATNIKGNIGSMTLKGNGKVDFGAKPTLVHFDGYASNASLPGLMTYLTPSLLPSDLQQVVSATSAQLEDGWSRSPFDTSSFKSLQGSVKLKFGRMKLMQNAMLQKGEFRASLNNGSLTFQKIRGRLYNGAFSASGSMSSTGGPIALKASVQVDGADLAELFVGRDRRPLARGEASVNMSFSGEGLSPLGLVSVLRGRGRLNIREGEIFDFSPEALSDVIAKSTGDKENSKALSDTFLASLRGQSFPLRNIRAQMSMQSGVIRLNKVKFNSGSTQANANALLELSSMKVDSEWLLRSGSRSRTDLPGVRMVFAGPLTKIASLPPSVDTSRLSQTLAVRKIEKGFDTLKKLNERDPETIRKLREQQERENGGSTRYSNVPAEKIDSGSQAGRNERGFTTGSPGRAGGNAQDDGDDGQLPALTNLGSIDKNRKQSAAGNDDGQIGSQYSYESNPDQDQQGANISQLTAEEAATRDELLRQLEEEDNKSRKKVKKRRRKKQEEEKSFFDSLFDG